MTIQQALKISAEKLKQKNIPSAFLDAEVLLMEVLNRCGKSVNKSWLYINSNYSLNKKEEKLFNNFINQRKKHKPVAYIINRKEFYGYDFYVDENVLIPRPETEFVAAEAIKIIDSVKNEKKSLTLIDIGAGSGCVIISILNELAKLRKNKIIKNAIANDISPKAIRVAEINAEKYNLAGKIKFVKGDLKKAISGKIFHNAKQILITANLPYIKNTEFKTLPQNIRLYEPQIALRGGKKGICQIKRLSSKLSGTQFPIAKKIWLIIEIDPRQIKPIKKILKEKFRNIDIKVIKDFAGKSRVISVAYSLTL